MSTLFLKKIYFFLKNLENGVKWVDVWSNMGPLGRSGTDTVKD